MNTQGLLEFQIPAAEQLLAALKLHGAALDGSDCGVGKTYHAAAVIRELDQPTLVVCPKISVTSWHRALEQMRTGACVKNYESLATGRTPYGQWQFPLPAREERELEYVCQACQCTVDLRVSTRCHVNHLGIHCISPKRTPHNYGRFNWYSGIQVLIFDEVHRCGALDSLNADMLTAAKRQGIRTLALSATAADSPLGLKALGFVLGLHGGPRSFYSWALARGCKRPVFGGLHFLASEERKRSIMANIHRDLFPSRGVRVRVNEIPGFPACQVKAELYDLENSGRIDELYATMDDAISLLNTMKLTDKSAEHPLTVLLRSSQAIELLKVPLFIAIRDSALEAGHSVAIFVSYRQTVDELLKRMKIEARICGGQWPSERQHWIDSFQRNDSHTIVANIAAGGVSISLHDTLGRPRTGIASLHPSAVKMRQVFGRLARAGGLSPALYRIPLVAGTVEEKVHRRLVSKLNNLDSLNDADLISQNLPLVTGNISEILDVC